MVCLHSVFEESEISYWFMANSAKDQDEWSVALSSGRYHTNNEAHLCFCLSYPNLFILLFQTCSYEYLRMAFSELRGQLMHLTGMDPLMESHPLGGLPIKVSSCYLTHTVCCDEYCMLWILPLIFLFQNVSPVPGKLTYVIIIITFLFTCFYFSLCSGV